MRLCNEISRWVTENIQRPLEEWIERTERRCRERPCNWWCLCCNKWFCFLVTIFVRIVVWITVTVSKFVTEVICVIISVVLDILALGIGLILSIPVIGGVLRAILNWLTDIIFRILSLPDLILSHAGIMIRKKIYVKGIILNSNGVPVAPINDLDQSIIQARNIFLRECNVELVYTGTCVPNIDTPEDAQNINCGINGFFNDMRIQGSYFELVSIGCAYENGHNRILGYASEVLVFVVNNIEPNAVGCSFGATHNYVTVENSASRNIDTVAHEIGHACNLTHSDNPNNLMARAGIRINNTMSTSQRAWFRSSKHCVFI